MNIPEYWKTSTLLYHIEEVGINVFDFRKFILPWNLTANPNNPISKDRNLTPDTVKELYFSPVYILYNILSVRYCVI